MSYNAWTDFHGEGTFVTGVKVGLSVGLQVAGDVGCAQHLSTDATGDFAFVSDHVGTESVFGGKSGGTSLQRHGRQGQCSAEQDHRKGNNSAQQSHLPLLDI